MMKGKFLGQCGFRIWTEQLSVAIDPVLNELVDDTGKSIRKYPPVMAYEDLKVDVICCTHDHIDHMAKETVIGIARDCEKTLFVVPKGCVEEMLSWGIAPNKVFGLSDGEALEIKNGAVLKTENGENSDSESGKLRITGLSTAHPVHAVDEAGLDHNLAFSLDIDGKRLVHLGDTYHTERLEKSLRSLGPIDVLLPPINGRDEYRESLGIIGNLSYEQAADLANRLGVKCTIPTHFDMVIGNTEDPEKLAEYMRSHYPDREFLIPVLNKEFVF